MPLCLFFLFLLPVVINSNSLLLFSLVNLWTKRCLNRGSSVRITSSENLFSCFPEFIYSSFFPVEEGGDLEFGWRALYSIILWKNVNFTQICLQWFNFLENFFNLRLSVLLFQWWQWCVWLFPSFPPSSICSGRTFGNWFFN